MSRLDDYRDSVNRPLTSTSIVTIAESGSNREGLQWERVRVKNTLSHKIRNTNREHWRDAFRYSHSALPKVLAPTLGITLWAVLVCLFYLVPQVSFLKKAGLPNTTVLVTVIGTAISLLLVFRVNTAYDRYWEGRKVWTTMHSQIRNLARILSVYSKVESENDKLQVKGVINLLIAFATSTKHALRNEWSPRYEDVGPYIQHIKDFSASAPTEPSKPSLPLPLEISLHLQSFITKNIKTLPGPATLCLNSLVDSLSSFQRIRTTPIPAAYTIHLRQTVMVYFLSLPFQLVAGPLGWFTIPVCFMGSIVVLGIEAIGREIENPFGYDLNDLPQDEYCTAISDDLRQILDRLDSCEDDSKQSWIHPMPLSEARIDLLNVRNACLPTGNADSRFSLTVSSRMLINHFLVAKK